MQSYERLGNVAIYPRAKYVHELRPVLTPAMFAPSRARLLLVPLYVALIAFANGICAGLGFPAFQAILPDLVPVEDLPGAIALSSAQYNLGRVVGPVLAGVVIAIGGYAWAEAVNAVVARVGDIDIAGNFADSDTMGLAELARAASGGAKAFEEAVAARAERVGRLCHDEQERHDERHDDERSRPRRDELGPL